MKLVTTFISALTFPSAFRAVPFEQFVQGNNLPSDTMSRDVSSNNNIVQAEDVLPKTISSNAILTSPEKTSIVPIGTKTYVAGLRSTAGGNSFCSASLISPTHLLVGTYCAVGDIRWASIGLHYVNGTQGGEQLKVVAILNHPRSSIDDYDFAVLVLQNPSKFAPVALAKPDDSDVTDGESAARIGWDDSEDVGRMGYEMIRTDVQLMSNFNCAKEAQQNESMLCSRGATNETACIGPYGGPVVVEHSSGDVIVGVVSWGGDCNKPGNPNIYSRVSSARAWIDSVVKGVCFY